jgi:hypothetical protein
MAGIRERGLEADDVFHRCKDRGLFNGDCEDPELELARLIQAGLVNRTRASSSAA